MDGLAFVQMVERELKRRGIPKERFYKESGISSATMSQWRKRIYSPSSTAIKKIEDYLSIVFSIEHKYAPTPEDERSIENKNVIRIAGRDGSFVTKVLTDEQLHALKTMIEHLPDASDYL